MLAEAVTVAIESMSWVDYEGLSERAALLRTARQLGVDDADSLRAAYRLLAETQRHLAGIDYTISQALGAERFEKLTLGVKNSLRIIVYSKHWTGSSAHEIARILSACRRAIGWRELAPFEYEIAQLAVMKPFASLNQMPEPDRISIQYSHPKWFVQNCIRALGRAFTLKMLRRNQKPAPNYVVTNPLKTSDPGRVKSSLEKIGIELEEAGAKWLFKVRSAKRPIPATKAYRTGSVLPVDKSSFYVALALAAKSGSNVLDTCAAPGVKTAMIAMQMKNRGTIIATDLSTKRIQTALSALSRLGISNAQFLASDARNPLPIHHEFDQVLVDPPCSNSGVFMRTPSARWRMSAPSMENLQLLQREILSTTGAYVAPGGCLVYSTCSVLPEENEIVVEQFLRTNPDFQLVNPAIPEGMPGLRGMVDARRLYPQIHECNGFFIAKMMRT